MKKIRYIACLLALSLLGVCWYMFPSSIQHIFKKSTPAPTEGQTSEERIKLTVDDIGFTIKTSEKFHSTRIDLILKTWFIQTNGQINFITDSEDAVYQKKSGNKLIKSGCGKSHGLYGLTLGCQCKENNTVFKFNEAYTNYAICLVDLCCKVGREYDIFIADTSKRWWCHFDDDNYVNVGSLVNYLDQFDDKKDWYIGRKSRPNFKSRYKNKLYVYKFGTGGGGVCISRPLAVKMQLYCGSGTFPRTCQAVAAADDCAIGLIVTKLIGTNLTESPIFHSHIEKLGSLSSSTLTQQACLSYNKNNVVNLPASLPQFSKEEDPTRILSLHCNIYPKEDICAPLARPDSRL